MRTDGIECWNKDCVYRDRLFEFSCKAHVGLEEVDADQYVERCRRFMRRTPEHAAVVKTLMEFCRRYKRAFRIADKWGSGTDTFVEADSKAYAYKMAIWELAHNWLSRNKKGDNDKCQK